MVRFDLLFVTFLLFLTGIEVRADEFNEKLHQEKNDIPNAIPEQENNEKKDINQGNEGVKSTSENLYDKNFFSEEKEKVSQEEIAANQSILNESVKENQSGFFGWLGRFIGNILDEINTDRIVDFLWNKSTMKHEGNEEYKAAKGKIDRFLIRKAFRGLFRKYLEGKEINEGNVQNFNGEYDKVKILADIFSGANNIFEEDSLRLIILEKILGDRDDDIRGLLAALDNVSEEKMVELQSLLADLKNNEEEFVKCFADMSAVEKYNLERAAFYDKKGNYCKSQWMMVDKDGIHDTLRGPIIWIKNIWKVLRFVIGFLINCFTFSNHDNGEINDVVRIAIISIFLLYSFLMYLINLFGQFIGFKSFFTVSKTILFISFVAGIIKNNEKFLCICLNLSILHKFFEGIFGLKYIFNKKINKNLAFLLNKKFRYIKNYVETLKKIHALIKNDEVLAGAFKTELLSFEKVFGDEASNETKHMLAEMDKQQVYNSFEEVEDTGEAMFLFDKNKDIFSDCIVDVNKINACVAIKKNVPAEKKDVKEHTVNQEENKKVENEPEGKNDVKESIDNQEENKKVENKSTEKNDVKEHFVTQKQEKNKKEENKSTEKNDVKEHTANQEENKNEEQLDEKVRSDEYKKNKRRANKKRKRKRSAKKRRVRTNKNKRKIENPRNENTPVK